ncbi:6476_t:CDS:1, partial [Gigaspora margarita]
NKELYLGICSSCRDKGETTIHLVGREGASLSELIASGFKGQISVVLKALTIAIE